MTPAQMPEELIEKPPRFVRDLAVGETAWIHFAEIRVERHTRPTFVNTHAEI